MMAHLATHISIPSALIRSAPCRKIIAGTRRGGTSRSQVFVPSSGHGHRHRRLARSSRSAPAAARDFSFAVRDDAEDATAAAAATAVSTSANESEGGDDVDKDSWGPWEPPLPPFDHEHQLLTWDIAQALLDAKEAGAKTFEASLDFGITTVSLALLDDGFALANTDHLLLARWDEVVEVAADEKGTYVLHPDAPVDRFQVFSEATSRAVSLMPTSPGMAPTALIAGFSMHRFGVGVDPMEDTARKLGAVHPIRPGARVLDICTGLAYTAVGAHAKGGRVTTIELDPAMTEMCRMNPHSKDLFGGGIRQLYGNAADVVPTLPDASFDRIIHDPPTFALAGELFSAEFYGHLRRILAKKGRLYHYIGDPSSKSAGNVAKGVVQRLKQTGFGGVAIDYNAHGVIAAHGHVKVNSKKVPQKSFGRAAGGGKGKGTSTDRRRGARGDEGGRSRGGAMARKKTGGGGRMKRGRGGGRRGGGRGYDDEYGFDDDDDFFKE